jgi:flagellar biosynthesis/type III secretory pathway protein FliH
MLDHLNKPVAELKTPIEDWAYVFKDRKLRYGAVKVPVTKKLQEIELIANRNPGIRAFIERIDVKNLPNEVRDRHMRAIQYYNTTIMDIEEKAVDRGIKKGEREGLLKGIEKGKREALLKAARVLKELKTMSHAEIAIKLDLTEADVSGIKID